MSYNTILTGLKSRLDAVSGIGKTYDYFRNETDITTQKTLFTNSNILHVWMLTRSAVPDDIFTNSSNMRRHQFDLWGYYAVNDANATEKTFQALVDTILNKFNDNDNIKITDGMIIVTPCSAPEITHVVWCNVLCHRAHIVIPVDEEKSYA